MPLVQCSDHKYAPAVIVCRHLYSGESSTWCPVSSGDPEVDHDWLCPACHLRYPYLEVEDLRCVCLNCARRLRRSAGRNDRPSR
jgi:hypothetical protein